jgi:hypothetical protein
MDVLGVDLAALHWKSGVSGSRLRGAFRYGRTTPEVVAKIAGALGVEPTAITLSKENET